MKVNCDVKEISVTQTALAKAMGYTKGRINQMIKDGVIVLDPACSDGAVLLYDSLKNFYNKTYGKSNNNDSSQGQFIDFNAEHARLEKLKADKEEIRVRMLMGELYEASTVELVMSDIYVTLRTKLLGIPSKISSQMPEQVRADVNKILTTEIETALLEMSQYSPEMFKSEVEE